MSAKHQELVGLIWSVADLLRGDYRQSEYGKVILPFTVLRRLDCVAPKPEPELLAVIDEYEEMGIQRYEHRLEERMGYPLFKKTTTTYQEAVKDAESIGEKLPQYVKSFSSKAVEILESYDFLSQIARLDELGLLYQVAHKFAEIDLHPKTVDNHQMGYIFEDLIRRFSEISNDTAGEHFTPREVVRLMVNLLLVPDEESLTGEDQRDGVVKRIFDPACGTGGMLAEAHDQILRMNPDATITVYGQELNPESYAICLSDMILKGQTADNIKLGNSISNDEHLGKTFDYILANPPFGVEWKKVKSFVEKEQREGYEGRFGAGLPRVNDGSLLFLQHMLHKMKPVRDGGSRIGIVFNGSPLFSGGAESGESNIRRWILEHDWLEAVVALPDQLFYNTGIATYFWILTNRKENAKKDRVILFDARDHSVKMRRSLGEKRKLITEEQIEELTKAYESALEVSVDPAHPMRDKIKVVGRAEFGYQRITIERPLRLIFEVRDSSVDELAHVKSLAGYEPSKTLFNALRALIGSGPFGKKVEFAGVLAETLNNAGLGKLPKSVEKAVWGAVSRPDPKGEIQRDRMGSILPDPDLREFDNIPLGADAHEYLQREVHPLSPDAWIDHEKTKIGYEIPFTRYFFEFKAMRSVDEIDADLRQVEDEIQLLLKEIAP
ncbi:type I restriction enzyme M protein [Streptomyces achromogenes]|uniref:type I restriction-modification system subunit M n=1 Tax=Streptomyces achromogenes TaxID=67255 RepID=UPI002785DFEB|nr:class I SAM-dependent DNA methyltransferase [Streptomyces achromogenes]MDQ0833676.1 type I restriction enzyme M protein [Streptomyces achromogenes]